MSQGKLKTAFGYKSAMNSLKAFQTNLSFYDITKSFLTNYTLHMTSQDKSITTVGFYLRDLRAIYKIALNEGILKDSSAYPFRKGSYVIPQPRNIKKGLTIEQIKAIYSFTQFNSKAEQVARDFWILIYLCNGVNPGDLLRLRWSDKQNDEIRLVRKKTAGTNTTGLPLVIYL